MGRIAQSVQRLSYGLDGPGDRIPVGARFSAPVQTGSGAHSVFCTMGTGSFPGVKIGQGVTLTPHSLLVPWSRKSRAISLLLLWAVRLVESLSACTRVHFTFYFTANVLYIFFRGFPQSLEANNPVTPPNTIRQSDFSLNIF